MRTLCDSCERAEAIVFCAADEAALCRSCDEKIHLCNKLANRHVRVGLVEPCDVPRCDICEKAPAFFYCEVDGSSLCMQCDMTVHIGGKRTHERFLLLRQRVEFPVDKPGRTDELGLKPPDDPHESVRLPNQPPRPLVVQNHQSHRISPVVDGKMEHERFDLNAKPQQMNGQSSNNQATDAIGSAFHEAAGMAPVGSFIREPEK